MLLPRDAPFARVASQAFTSMRVMTVDDAVAWIGTYSAIFNAREEERAAWLGPCPRRATAPRHPGGPRRDPGPHRLLARRPHPAPGVTPVGSALLGLRVAPSKAVGEITGAAGRARGSRPRGLDPTCLRPTAGRHACGGQRVPGPPSCVHLIYRGIPQTSFSVHYPATRKPFTGCRENTFHTYFTYAQMKVCASC